ncbi:MAG: 50S ribosomal protein L40e [Thermoprotei archaeon]|nr:50S ribosomal protein L40e [Thermoprotei archaeon]
MALRDPEMLAIFERRVVLKKVCRKCGALNPISAVKCRRCRSRNLRVKKRFASKK